MKAHEVIVTVVEKVDEPLLGIPDKAFSEFSQRRLDALLAVHPEVSAKLQSRPTRFGQQRIKE